MTDATPDYPAAIQRALNELGVPQPGYPQPVANAVEILREVMGQPLLAVVTKP